VSNYVRALEHGVKRVRDGFPISNRLFREVHTGNCSRTVEAARSFPASSAPRRTGSAARDLASRRSCLHRPIASTSAWRELEKFLHDLPERTPVLLKAALAHVQFETIHPFLDGNGRLGRLLITLLLVSQGVLREPLLYLSLYFKQNRSTYYELLQSRPHRR
jgi:Fic family protein